MIQIDLNCDMGEGVGHDAEIMPFISSANIACGYHAGDTQTMTDTIMLAKQHGVAIGAHPSYPDKANFGRTSMNLAPHEIYEIVLNQIRILGSIAKAKDTRLTHVKPHGALYHAAAIDRNIADAIVSAMVDFDPSLILFGLANSEMIQAAQVRKLSYKQEVFADRTYQADGTLTPRAQPNALIASEQDAINQVMQMINQKMVRATNGSLISINADTICIHGDGVHAVNFAMALNKQLSLAGIKISAS